MNTTSVEMPKYQCHKQVWALKIRAVEVRDAVSVTGKALFLVFEDARYSARYVTLDWVSRHGPQAGGYFVVYKDGYESFSPAAEFEDGYTRIPT